MKVDDPHGRVATQKQTGLSQEKETDHIMYVLRSSAHEAATEQVHGILGIGYVVEQRFVW